MECEIVLRYGVWISDITKDVFDSRVRKSFVFQLVEIRMCKITNTINKENSIHFYFQREIFALVLNNIYRFYWIIWFELFGNLILITYFALFSSDIILLSIWRELASLVPLCQSISFQVTNENLLIWYCNMF